MQHLSKEQIIAASQAIFTAFTTACEAVDENIFFERPAENKWSVGENVQHLITSTNITTLAYTLPGFIVRWIGGTPNRKSRSYEELVEKYKVKLSQGGRASGRFVPKRIKGTKKELLAKWNREAAKFIAAIHKDNTESKLDNYLARHPLLGRITLRELCYFTIYHTEHHLNIINTISNTKHHQQ